MFSVTKLLTLCPTAAIQKSESCQHVAQLWWRVAVPEQAQSAQEQGQLVRQLAPPQQQAHILLRIHRRSQVPHTSIRRRSVRRI